MFFCRHKYGDYRTVVFTDCCGDQGQVVKKCKKCGKYKVIPRELESAISVMLERNKNSG